jgi:crotonobetainyl-CoA:carnitine CoA-transferase CaiB-like acyl-CoA transferase
MIDYSWHRRSWPRCGNADPVRAPQGCYPTVGNDTWMVVSAEDDEQWRALCRVLDRGDWLGRADLVSVAGRSAVRAELDAGIALWTSSREARAASEELQGAGVAAAPVMGGYDLLADPHLAARSFIEWINREHVGTLAHTGMWAKFSRTPGTIRRPAPTLGQHNRHVLTELLGLSSADLAELESNGVISTQAGSSRSPLR